MSSLEMITAYVKEYREEVEPHWHIELLYGKFTAAANSPVSAGYCGPTSVLLWKRLKASFPSEQFSIAVGRVYKDSTEHIKGKHVWVVWHQKLEGAIIIDATADQSGKQDEKIIVEDIDALAKQGVNYIPYQFASTLEQVDESPKRRAKLLEAKLS